MKILFLTHHWANNSHHASFSGYQQLVNEAKKNHECSVVTWGNSTKICDEDGVRVYYVKPIIKKDIFFSKRLAVSKFARSIENEFDVVHALYTDCAFYQKHSNLISTLHVSPQLTINKKSLGYLFLALKRRVIEKRVFNRSKHIITVSNNLLQGLQEHKLKSTYIPHGINADYWSPKEFQDRPPENDYVLSVGNNGVDKDALIEAVKTNGNLRFVVVGLRNFEFNHPNLIKKNRISDAELKQLYYHCRFFIRPMLFATANNSVLEALSMGKPVLISTPDGIYDYFENNLQYVTVVENKSFADEVEKYSSMLNSFSRQDSDDIRKYLINRFSWNKVFEQTFKLYL